MGVPTTSKINSLVHSKYAGGLMFSEWLNKEGYSKQLLQKYRTTGWIKTVCRGVMAMHDTTQNALVSLACYNEQLGKRCRVAAHSALELAGFNHYVPMGKPTLMVACTDNVVPTWMKSDQFDRSFVPFSTEAFPKPSTTLYRIGDYELLMSSPEQAFMECLLLAPKRYTLMDLFYIMEQLTSLRPDVVQSLLETSTNYKIKRLFLYMAEKANHYWVEMLDKSRIDLGTSKMQLVKGGVYISQYKITIPKELYDYE